MAYLLQCITGIDVEYLVLSNEDAVQDKFREWYRKYGKIEPMYMNESVVKMVMFRDVLYEKEGRDKLNDMTVILNECKYRRITGGIYDMLISGCTR